MMTGRGRGVSGVSISGGVVQGSLAGALAFAALLALSACGDGSQTTIQSDAQPDVQTGAPAARAALAAVDHDRLLAIDTEPGQWLTTGRGYEEQHYSPLDRINTENVADLGLDWFADFDTNQNQEATPLYIDGKIYVTTAWSKVYAYDARTGETLWHYDPKVPGEWQQNACCGVVNRGAAAWNGKIYVGALDGRLIALDAGTGEEVWSTRTFDHTDLPRNRYAITGAPRVVKGKVLIGNGGAEFGVRGFVAAYDAETGEEAWRFWTVPGNPADGFENEIMEMAAETWNGEWWRYGGGGTVWDGMAYDPESDLVFIGTGNGSPWNAEIRSPGGGDNLFLASILALDPDTGEYVWHYQTAPGETWDYTATAPLIVATLEIGGEDRRVVMQTPKNGYFYVLDVYTGELISAEPIVPVNWSLGIDEAGAPIQNPETRFDRHGGAAWVTPGPAGGHSWHPMAYSPRTGLVYIPARYTTYAFQTDENFEFRSVGTNWGIDPVAATANAGPMPDELRHEFGGSVLAWDPVRQEKVWEFPHRHEGPNGGILVTAGDVVFQGNLRDQFAAYHAVTGEQLWTFDTQTGAMAAPIAYELDGEQYIAVVPGRAAQHYYAPNYSRLLVFRLGGTAVLPEPVEYTPPPIAPPARTASADIEAHGERLYQNFCAVCHGDSGAARSTFPDLRRSARLNSQDAFDAVVLHGALSENGMAGFAADLGEVDSQALRAYSVAQAHEALARGPQGPSAAPPQAAAAATDSEDMESPEDGDHHQ